MGVAEVENFDLSDDFRDSFKCNMNSGGTFWFKAAGADGEPMSD